MIGFVLLCPIVDVPSTFQGCPFSTRGIIGTDRFLRCGERLLVIFKGEGTSELRGAMWSGAHLRVMDEGPGWTVLEPGVPEKSVLARELGKEVPEA